MWCRRQFGACNLDREQGILSVSMNLISLFIWHKEGTKGNCHPGQDHVEACYWINDGLLYSSVWLSM